MKIRSNTVYQPSPIQAFAGNPLIEALPPIRSDNEWIKSLFVLPKVRKEERKLNPELRLAALIDFERFNYPLPEYLDFSRRIESALYRGYSSKNPLLPTSNHYLHYLDADDTPVQPVTGRFEARPTGITLVGPSGCGKSRMYESILEKYPQVIEHDVYNGRKLPIKQLVWLRISCPEDQSLVTFAAHFLSEIDNVLGTDYFNEVFKARNNKGVIKEKVIRLTRIYRIGLIVLDEFSNLKLPRNATVNNVPPLVKLILNLMNGSGVPIIYCGNPEMLDVIQLTLKTARRAENGGVITMNPMHHSVWTAVSKRLWPLQITNKVTPWNERQSNILYEASHGLIDFAVRGFFEAQRIIIGTGDERLTDTVIQAGVENVIRLSGKLLKLSIIQNNIKDEDTPKPSNMKSKEKKKKVASNINIFDPYRTQHKEFETIIEALRNKKYLIPDRIKPDILRESINDEHISKKLIDNDIILEDVVNMDVEIMASR